MLLIHKSHLSTQINQALAGHLGVELNQILGPMTIAKQSGHPSSLRYAETLPVADFHRSEARVKIEQTEFVLEFNNKRTKWCDFYLSFLKCFLYKIYNKYHRVFSYQPFWLFKNRKIIAIPL